MCIVDCNSEHPILPLVTLNSRVVDEGSMVFFIYFLNNKNTKISLILKYLGLVFRNTFIFSPLNA
jgi:hypothetical protein